MKLTLIAQVVSFCCVAPESRRLGAGRKMIEWGTRIADERGIECFVESTEDGVKLYESADFIKLHPFSISVEMPEGLSGEERQKWEAAKKKFFPEPQTGWMMWRPKGGKVRLGVCKKLFIPQNGMDDAET